MKNRIILQFILITFAMHSYANEPFKAGDFMIRARAIQVTPDEHGQVSNGDDVGIDNQTVPEFDFTYFFTPNISAELIAAVTQHNVTSSSGIKAGDVWLLPPTLTLQYHFTDIPDVIPYVGAGINYTHFFNEDGGTLARAVYDDSIGPVFQVGADVPISNHWYFNLDVKKVYISTDVRFSPSGVTADVDIDPWIFGLGVGYRF